MKNLVKGEKVKGSPLLDCDKIEIGAKVNVKSMHTVFKIMKWAVAKCSSVKLKIMGESVPSLLDSHSMVSLMQQDYLIDILGCSWDPAEGSVTDAYHIFDLTSASGGAIPLSRYVELDVEFWGLQVPMAGFLITHNPNEVLDPEHKARLSRIVGWNLVKLAYQEFLQKLTLMCLRTLNAQMESILCCFLSCVFITMLM